MINSNIIKFLNMAYINKYKLEAALKGAEDLLRVYESNPLSETYIAAESAVATFKYVLELCKEEIVDAIAFRAWIQKNDYHIATDETGKVKGWGKAGTFLTMDEI